MFICIVLISVVCVGIFSSGGWLGLSVGFSSLRLGMCSVLLCFWKNSLLFMLFGLCISDIGCCLSCGSSCEVMVV